MKSLQYILYGIIIGHWLMHVRERLCADKVKDRYAVVGMHSSKDEYIFVGLSSDRHKALDATSHIEDNSICYIGICYDLCDPDDRNEFESKTICPVMEAVDAEVMEEARGML